MLDVWSDAANADAPYFFFGLFLQGMDSFSNDPPAHDRTINVNIDSQLCRPKMK
jgi:hypothetical protein